MSKEITLSANDQKILNLLSKATKPLGAYEILDKLKIKTPPTVYRALDSLSNQGLVHRIQSLNAFVACKENEASCCKSHDGQFMVCKKCKNTVEIHNHKINEYIKKIAKELNFQIESKMLEISGICTNCLGK